MITLRDAIISSINRESSQSYTISPPEKILKISEEIEKRYSRVENPLLSKDIDQIRDIFISASNTGSWHNIEKTLWEKACWILWIGEEPIAGNEIFLNKYLQFCKSYLSKRLLKYLIHVYLQDFKKVLPGRVKIAIFIREQLNSERFIKLLSFWKEKDDLYALFDSDKDFYIHAKDYLQNSLNAKNFLFKLGLDEQFEASNYTQEIFDAIISEVEKNIINILVADLFFDKLKDFSIKEHKKLRYPQKKCILIESLLRPWKEKSPPVELRKKILEFLVINFLDPRTNEGRSNWVGVNDGSIKIIRRWLAGVTLEQFFQIIDSTAKKQWLYRRQFWKSYYDAGYLDDAWIALGKISQIEAQSAYGDELIAATIQGYGVKPDHSVLILKIGELTICEWSHEGKCRIWHSNNKKSPRLYENIYLAQNLREFDDFKLPHQNSKQYTWQKKLSDHIEYHTGIKISKLKYEVN